MINFNRVWAVTLRHLYLWRRSLGRVFDAIYWPALDVLIWGFVSVYMWQRNMEDINLITLFLGGMIFYRIFTQVQGDISIAFLEEVWNNNLLNLFASPLNVWEYQLGQIILSLLKLVLSVLTMLTLAWILYAFNIFKFGFFIIPFVICLIIFGWAIGFIANAIILRFGRNLETMAWAIPWSLMPFSGVFYPPETLPIWGQKVSALLPTTYIFEGMRQIIKSGGLDSSYLVTSFIFSLIYLIVSLLLFKTAFEHAREKGILKKVD